LIFIKNIIVICITFPRALFIQSLTYLFIAIWAQNMVL